MALREALRPAKKARCSSRTGGSGLDAASERLIRERRPDYGSLHLHPLDRRPKRDRSKVVPHGKDADERGRTADLKGPGPRYPSSSRVWPLPGVWSLALIRNASAEERVRRRQQGSSPTSLAKIQAHGPCGDDQWLPGPAPYHNRAGLPAASGFSRSLLLT